MLNDDMTLIAVAGLAAISIGLIVYVIMMPFLSGERKSEKRIESVKTGATSRERRQSSAAVEAIGQRKKEVQDTLNEMEERRKKRDKVTTRVRLLRAGLDMSPNSFWMICLVFGMALGGIALFYSAPIIAVAGIAFAAGLGFPRWLLSYLAKRRQKKFIDELANAMDVIVRGVKSGLPLNDCLRIVANESPDPLRSEFADLVEQQRVGVPLAEAFERMHERMPLQEVTYFAIVIAIQQQAGGNLSEALGNLSAVLRDRKRLVGKVRALAAEAKAGAMIIGSLPIIMLLAVSVLNPEYIEPLFTERVGHVILGGSAIWMLSGVLVMRKMINFDF